MSNKEKQRKRTKRIFINAAKTIIKTDGISAVSARKIGEISGYSYATIYNYYNDINQLLFEVAFDYLNDCYKKMVAAVTNLSAPRERIITYSTTYFKYMAAHPAVFKIAFIYDYSLLHPIENEDMSPKVATLLKEELNNIPENLIIGDKSTVFELLSSSVHGRLLFYIHKRSTQHIEEHITQLTNEIKLFIKEN